MRACMSSASSACSDPVIASSPRNSVTVFFMLSWIPALSAPLQGITKGLGTFYKYFVDIFLAGAFGLGVYFWFSGRSDDVFKVKGLWVSPIEVEAAITEHEAVMEAAVVSFEDSDGLTQAKAFIVLNPGAEISDDLVKELKDGVRKIGGYKVPAEMDFVAALPRTTLMKIDRRTLREMEAERREKG